MSVYVDELFMASPRATHLMNLSQRHGHHWCHMYADTPEELHAFAKRLGLKREWQHVSRRGVLHYDLIPTKREAALRAGAIPLARAAARDMRERLRA